MTDELKPDLDLTNLSTSLNVKNIKMIPLGIGLNRQGPQRSFAESRACGKVIFSGEHAVVYGAKALALPLLSKMIHLKIYADPHLTASPKVRFNIGERPVNESLKAMVVEAFDVLAIPRFNVSMEGQTSLLLGAGVGSSASLCVSVLRGLAQLSGKSLTPIELAKLANQLERRFHGNPSGLDASVVALEQPILFERGKDPEVVKVHKPKNARFPWTFVLLDSGVRSQTINMVKHAEPFFREGRDQIINEFNQVTENTKSALEDGDIQKMTEAINHGHMLLTEAGVVTSILHDISRIARDVGALATKVTGAGGGGCMLSLLENERCDEQISALRERLGKDRVHPLFVP